MEKILNVRTVIPAQAGIPRVYTGDSRTRRDPSGGLKAFGNDIFKNFIFLFIAVLFFSFPLFASENFDFSTLKTIPILDQGRVKPFDTFARESVQTITGSSHYEEKDPVETILIWLAHSDQVIHQPLILSRYEPLNQQIHITPVKGRVSSEQLLNNDSLKGFFKTIFSKQQEGENLNATEKKGLELYQQLELFHRILSGSALTFFPESNLNNWKGIDTVSDPKLADLFKGVVRSFSENNHKEFDQNIAEFSVSLQELGKDNPHYPTQKEMKREVVFNKVHPFQKAWILFLISFIFVLLSLGIKSKKSSSFLYFISLSIAFIGVGVSVYGFVLRALISGRPPVTNMYESVIWVSFGSMIFALIFEAIYRSRYFLLSASAVASVGLLLADNLPQALNPAIHPLVPVLRSNFWLTIHVLTITLSYAAFALAMGVGQVVIGYYAFKSSAKEKIRNLNFFLYRSLQVGVVLLAAGTILGGVWANYSWGRFWGWDPKEVWALIALLGYLAILHGRFAGWLKDFGLAVWSVLAFLLVVMAWYGVNFVLGVGLHSYGFSSGGFTWVMIFVGLQFLWVLFATVRYKRSHPERSEGSS